MKHEEEQDEKWEQILLSIMQTLARSASGHGSNESCSILLPQSLLFNKNGFLFFFFYLFIANTQKGF